MSASQTTLAPGAPDASHDLNRLLSLTRGQWCPTVLVIEDHEKVADFLRRALAQMKILAMVSHDGETGLKMASVMRFDFVILDILLPGKNGFEVFRALRNLPLMRDVPIMFLTCLSDKDSMAKGKELGAAHYLCKPFELAEFQGHVERILREEAERQAKAQGGRFDGR